MAAASRSNAVQIVINAKDNASKAVQGTTVEFVNLDSAAESAAKAIAAVGAGLQILVNVSPVINSLNGIYTGLQNIVSTVSFLQNNEIFQGLISTFADEADSAILSVDRDLVGLAGSVGTVGKSFSEGFIPGFAKIETVAGKVNAKIGGLFDRLGIGSKQTTQEIAEVAQTVTEALNEVEVKTEEAIEKGLQQKAVEAFNRLKESAQSAFDQIIEKAGQLKEQFDASEFGQKVSAGFLTLQTSAQSAFDQIIEKAGQLKEQFDAANLGDKAASGFAKLAEVAKSTFEQITEKAIQLKAQFNASEFGQKAASGFEKLATIAKSAFEQITEKASQLKEQFNASEFGQKAASGFTKLVGVAKSAFEQIKQNAASLTQSIGADTLIEKLQSAFAKFAQTAFAVFERVRDKFFSIKRSITNPETTVAKPPPLAAPVEAAATPVEQEITSQATTAVSSAAGASTAAFGQIEQQADLMSVKVQSSFKQAFNFSKIIDNGSTLKSSFNAIDNVVSARISGIQKGVGKLNETLASVGNVGASKPLKIFNQIKEGVGSATSSLVSLTQEFGFFASGLGALQQLATGGPFQLLIGQNVQLQEQLLSTKASLVSTNKVIQDGREIKDPTQAIQALEGPVNQAIDRLRAVSLDLVGVTSKELVPVYQLVAGYSSQIGINLNQVADLTASASAAMGTLKIPLYQSRQEIGSILSSTIDMNSVLAKSLGITNQQVNTWKSQGRVFQELTTRLEAFRAGNKLASETINGYASNIQEIFDIIGQKAGAQLLEPITQEMSKVYAYLKDSQDALIDLGSKVVKDFLDGAMAIADSLGIVFKSTSSIAGNLLLILSNAAKKFMLAIANGIKTVMPIIQPIITVLGKLIEQFGPLAASVSAFGITAKIASVAVSSLTGGFGFFLQLIPGVAPLLSIMTGQGNVLIRTFSLMNSVVGPAGGAMALFAQNLGMIPGGAGMVASQIGKLNPLLGMVAPAVAGAVPGLATWGIRLTALSKDFPIVGNAIGGILPMINQNSGALTKMAEKYAPMVEQYLPGMGVQLVSAAGKVKEFSEEGKLGTLVQEKFTEVTREAGKEMYRTVKRFALLAGTLVLIGLAINEFILKNKEVMDVLSGVFKGLGYLLGVIPQVGEVIWNFLITPTGAFTTALTIMAGVIYAKAVPSLLLFARAQIANIAIGFSSKVLEIGGAMKAMGLLSAEGAASVTALTAAMAGNTAIVEAGAASIAVLKAEMVAADAATAAAAAEVAVLEAEMAAGIGIAAETAAAMAVLDAEMVVAAAASTEAAAAIAVVEAEMVAATGAAGIFGAASVAAFAILTPLIAGLGAVFVFGLYAYKKALQDSAEATEVFSQQTTRLSDKTFDLTKQLKKNQDAQAVKTKAGIRLTDEEYKANQRLSAQAKEQLAQNIQQIDELKKAQSKAPEEYKTNYQGQINQLEALGKALQARANDMQIAGKELPRLGTAYEQFSQGVNTALEAIRNPSGEADKYKEQAGKLLEGTQAQLKGNLITADQAIARYELLATNAQLDKETQIKAQEAITAARKEGTDLEAEHLTAVEAKIKGMKDAGRIGDAESERQLTQIKQQELDLQLEALKKNKADADKVRADDLSKQLAESDKRIADAQKAIAAAQGDPAAFKSLIEGQQKDLKEGKDKILADLAQVEAELATTQADAKGKRGGEANKANSKAIDLQKKVVELNRSLGEVDKKASDLDTQAKNPPNGGKVDEGAVKALQDTLKKEQHDRIGIEEEFQNASKTSTLKFNDDQGKIEAEKAKEKEDALKKASEQRLHYQDEEQKILDSGFADKKVTEAKYNEDSLKISESHLNEELAEVKRQKKLLNAADTDGLHKLEAQEADINKRRIEAEEKFYQKRSELRLKHQDNMQKVLDGQLTQGKVSEEAFSDQSLQITKDRLDLEMAEIARQRSKLMKTDKEGLLNLAAQESDIAKKRTDALEKFLQQRTSLLERAEKEALDIAQLAAVERDTQLQELKNKNLIHDEEANEQQVNSDKERLDAQLEAEKTFLEKIEKLPKLSDPQKESEHQSQIRAARLKTAETTKQIIESEGKQQEAHVKTLQAVIDRALKDKVNGIEAERQKVQKVLDLQTTLTEALEFQNKILESRKGLEKSIADYVAGEYAVAASLTENASEKERIEKKAAEAHLKFLDHQQLLERRSLDNDILKNKLLLEREKIQLRMDKANLVAERAEKEAELEKVLADPKATSRQKRAAQLSVDAVGTKEDVLDYKGLVLDAEGKRQENDNVVRRQELDMKQDLEYDQARADYATKSKNPELMRQIAIEAENKADSGRQGYNEAVQYTADPRNPAQPPDYLEFLKSRGKAVPTLDTPNAQPANQVVPTGLKGAGSIVDLAPPTLTRPGVQTDGIGGDPQLLAAIQKLNQDLLSGLSGINAGTITQQNSIVNNLNGANATTQAATATGQETLKQLYSVMRLAKAQKGGR